MIHLGLEFNAKLTVPSKPMPLILDEEGRVVDTTGRTVQPMMRQPTIKVRITMNGCNHAFNTCLYLKCRAANSSFELNKHNTFS